MPTDIDLEDLEDPVVVRDLADAELVAIADDQIGELPLDQLGLEGEVTLALLGDGVVAGAVQVVDVGELESNRGPTMPSDQSTSGTGRRKVSRERRVYCEACDEFEMAKSYNGASATQGERDYVAIELPGECPVCGAELVEEGGMQ